MAEVTITPPVGGSQQDLLAAALGVKFQAFSPLLANQATAPVSGSVYGVATYAAAGAVITGIKLRNGVAAAGTLPTTARFGLADNAGKILVLSGNVNALASWPVGVCPFAFTATFTTTYSGIYFPCFTVNGTWGSTQPTPLNALGGVPSAYAADGANPIPTFTWTGQTDLPAVGASLSMPVNSRSFWMGLY